MRTPILGCLVLSACAGGPTGAAAAASAVPPSPSPAETVASGAWPITSRCPPDTQLTGALYKDVIRRVVRGNIRDVHDCYNAGLARAPDLRGRVILHFVISGDGSVCNAGLVSDAVADAEVGRCIARASMAWRFPPTEGGGQLQVTYPFVLEPG